MKPDWSRSPDWAEWAAQEASGSWYWYAERPKYSEMQTEWQTKGQRQIIPKVELTPQATLEGRPEAPLKFWWAKMDESGRVFESDTFDGPYKARDS